VRSRVRDPYARFCGQTGHFAPLTRYKKSTTTKTQLTKALWPPIPMEFETYSEELFHKLCKKEKIDIEKIQTQSDKSIKTPDYRLTKGGLQFGAEIKELADNPVEKTIINKVDSGKIVCDTYINDGRRIKSKIKKAGPQLKAQFKGEVPTILVIYDNRHFLNQFDSPSEEIKAAMFGGMETWISQDNPISSKGLDIFNRNRKLTSSSNTSISAIAHIYIANNNDVNMSVYHNPHASSKFTHGLLVSTRISEFAMQDLSNWREWSKIQP